MEEILGAIVSFGLKVWEVLKILWSMITGWFKENVALIRSSVNNLAFSLKKYLPNGKYEAVHGVYDKSTGELLDGKDLQSNALDEEMENRHHGKDLIFIK